MADESTTNTESVDGTLLRSASGAIYFIPADRLEEFRVPEEQSADVRDALSAADADVAGFASFELQPGVSSLLAFSGPLARVDTKTYSHNYNKSVYNG